MGISASYKSGEEVVGSPDYPFYAWLPATGLCRIEGVAPENSNACFGTVLVSKTSLRQSGQQYANLVSKEEAEKRRLKPGKHIIEITVWK